jgi:hypothetical protein
MESNGIPGKIQVSPAVYDGMKDKFSLKMRGVVEIQGKGEMMVYWLVATKYSNPKSFVNFLLPPRTRGEGWGGVKNLRLLQGLL